MIGTVAVLLLAVVAAAVVTLAVRLRQTRRELRETRAEAARLARATDILAEATATDILAGALGEPPVPRQHRRRRHLRALPVWLAGLVAGAWAWTRRQPALAGGIATVTAAGVAAVVLLPVLAGPEPTDPGAVRQPPIAAPPPPVEDFPDLPAPEPEPEPPSAVVPPAQAVPVQPLPPADLGVLELEPVAVERPALPAAPEPEPISPPEPVSPAPTPAPDPPEPTPTPTLPPEPPPAVDQPLLCVDVGLLGLVRLDLCLLP